MNQPNMSFGQAPAEQPAGGRFDFNEHGHLVHAGTDRIVTEQEKTDAVQALIDLRDRESRRKRAQQISHWVMLEELPEIKTDPDDARISVSKADIRGYIEAGVIQFMKEAGL